MDEKDKLIQKLLEKIAQLEKVIAEQAVIIAQQGERIAELERRLNKNSRNSSKPPSSDSFKKKPQNNREKTNKKSGGQKGHVGKTLLFSAPDEVVTLPVLSCECCNKDLSQTEISDLEKRQVHDIPVIKIHVTEYQAEKKLCCCGHMTVAIFPAEVSSAIQYGARIKGFALYLHNEQKLPYERCCTLLNDYYGASFCEGSLFNAQKKSYTLLEPIAAQTKKALIEKLVLHHDETGMQINKELHWLHVTSDSMLTFYGVHKKRGKEAIDSINILPQFTGVAIHDHWKSYYLYTHATHGLCNAHHLRELKSFEEEGQIWATKMRIFLQELCHLVNEAQRKNQTALADTIYQEVLSRYQNILLEGEMELPFAAPLMPGKRGRPKQPKGRNLLNRLRDYQSDVLRFAFDFNVPFTNNQAERDIRMVKLKQKISGGFRSFHGAEMFARICGYLSTMRKQGVNIAEAMTALAAGKPIRPNFC